MIYSFWIFDRHCDCIYSREWHKGVVNLSQEETAKLIFGITFSLRNIVRKLSDQDAFTSYNTSKYRLHFYETASNLRFVLVTDPKMENLQVVLQQIFVTLYLEFVVKNPLVETRPKIINNELFALGLDAFINSLPGFA